jgi:hypothetical protein
MHLIIDDNPNCSYEERVFGSSGGIKKVSCIRVEKPGNASPEWWDVMGVNENKEFSPAQAVRVEDSADGTAWLIYGGNWGLRLKKMGTNSPWSLEDAHQWGAPFFVLDSKGASIQFQTSQE